MPPCHPLGSHFAPDGEWWGEATEGYSLQYCLYHEAIIYCVCDCLHIVLPVGEIMRMYLHVNIGVENVTLLMFRQLVVCFLVTSPWLHLTRSCRFKSLHQIYNEIMFIKFLFTLFFITIWEVSDPLKSLLQEEIKHGRQNSFFNMLEMTYIPHTYKTVNRKRLQRTSIKFRAFLCGDFCELFMACSESILILFVLPSTCTVSQCVMCGVIRNARTHPH